MVQPAAFPWLVYLQGLVAVAVLAFGAWLWSLPRRDVSIADSLWSLLFVAMALIYAPGAARVGVRARLLLVLLAIWALRLSVYIAWRNRGQGEDRRYQAIRARNQPRFALKSLVLVFGLQAALAWVISLPLLGAIRSTRPLGIFDLCGVIAWFVGFVFEAGGDWQLQRFKADRASAGRVLDRGLWRYTRHPNYFGEFLIWWGYCLIALGAGAWWSVPGPLLMSVLLLKVSGVALLEKDIGERRPAYAAYVRRTNAFLPWPPRSDR
ncbi:MAG TPA: DUF1295 domain-containing protein [Candidatus Binataceae bacterium]|nr:DUF1295 domain-containing protein [Candidatus Binataceae bacterium]